jgi:glucose/arabinose dehydrogenase
MRTTPVVFGAMLVLSSAALAQGLEQVEKGIFRVQTHINRLDRVDATEERISKLQLPDGFRIARYAENLGNVRFMAVAPDGTVYATRREQGDVIRLRDTNGDGAADEVRTIIELPNVHGIAWHNNRLYLVTVREVYSADLSPDGESIETPRLLIDDLPDGGQHPNRTVAFDSSGAMIITVGSTCNACNETNPEAATILRATPDGRDRYIFARGLRNTLGFAWHPSTGEMWGMDHGTDLIGDDIPPEELNRLEEGKHYGWPHAYGKHEIDPQVHLPEEVTKEEWVAGTEPMVLGYDAHAAPMGMLFYNANQFPQEYRNDAFVAMRGSWNRRDPVGYEVVRIRFDDEGQPRGFEPFLRGFLIKEENRHFGRLVGLALKPDGSLLVSEDTNGMIYRIWYEGE